VRLGLDRVAATASKAMMSFAAKAGAVLGWVLVIVLIILLLGEAVDSQRKVEDSGPANGIYTENEILQEITTELTQKNNQFMADINDAANHRGEYSVTTGLVTNENATTYESYNVIFRDAMTGVELTPEHVDLNNTKAILAMAQKFMPYPLTTVSDNSDMYVYFSMTENQLLALTRQYGDMDEALKNMPEVELHLNDNSVYDKKGVIESISGVIDRQTGTVVARVVFPNESRLLHSGASGTVVVPSIYKDCIAIPQTATVRMQDKTIVYKVVDGKAVSTLITVAGINDGREYVVLSGLKAGDEIVSEGAGLVREGTQVK